MAGRHRYSKQPKRGGPSDEQMSLDMSLPEETRPKNPTKHKLTPSEIEIGLSKVTEIKGKLAESAAARREADAARGPTEWPMRKQEPDPPRRRTRTVGDTGLTPDQIIWRAAIEGKQEAMRQREEDEE